MNLRDSIPRLLFLTVTYIASSTLISATPFRVMPLGDSITQGCCSGTTIVGGYRPRLQSLLNEQGIMVDFVGTLSDSLDGLPLSDRNHQGYPGATIEFLRGSLSSWFSQVKNVDLILLDIGTNDFWSGSSVFEVETRFRKLLDDINYLSPKSTILVSNLLLRTDEYAAIQAEFRENYLGKIIKENQSLGRFVFMVDLFSAILDSDLTPDGVHPNLQGYFKMADAWAHAIVEDGHIKSNVVAPILRNGSFEVGEALKGKEAPQFFADNWFGVDVPIIVEATSWIPSTDGSRLALFNAGNDIFGGTLTQAFATVPGVYYQVNFECGIVVGTSWGPREQRLGVSVYGDCLLVDDGFTLSGEGGRLTKQSKSYTFLANSTSTLITLRDDSSSLQERAAYFSDLMVDNIRIIEVQEDNYPEASDDRYLAVSETNFYVRGEGILMNDNYNQLSPISILLLDKPDHGEVTLESGGGFTYVPARGYVGLDYFHYRIQNGILQSNIAKVEIEVREVPSKLANGSFEDGDVKAGAEFEQYQIAGWQVFGSPFGFSSVTNPKFKGTNGNRVVLFNGGSDEFGGTISQTFATIPGVDYFLTFDAGIIVGDGWGPRKQILGVLASGIGSLVVNEVALVGESGPATWTSGKYRITADSITTTITFFDKSAMRSSLTAHYSDLILDNVSFLVATPNAAPVCVGDNYEFHQDTPVVVPAPGIMSNDWDIDSPVMTASIVTRPGHGELVLYPDGGFTYVPNRYYIGDDYFTYLVNDGETESNIETVHLLVRGVASDLANGSFEIGDGIKDAPYEQFRLEGWGVTGGSFGFSASNNGLSSTNGTRLALFNGGDETFGGCISQTIATVPGQLYHLKFDVGIVVGAGWGPRQQALGVTVVGRGEILSERIELVGSDWPARWVPIEYEFVANSVTTKLAFTDLSGTFAGASAFYSDLLLDNVVLRAVVANRAPIAIAQSIILSEGGASRVSLAGTDAEGDKLQFSVIGLPEHGVLSGSAPDLMYEPNPNFLGDDQFSFTVDDGAQASKPAVVSIRVIPRDVGGYASWLERQGVRASASDDPDEDSVSNLLEYVLGGNPLGGVEPFILPTLSTASGYRGGPTPSLEGVVFSYRRTHEAKIDPSIAMTVQWAHDPGGPWKATSEAEGMLDLGTIESIEPGVDIVNLFLPSGSSAEGRLFARLVVEVLR